MAERFEYYITGDDLNQTVYVDRWLAQTFTPATAHKITSVKLLLSRDGLPGEMTVSIRETDASGHPTGGDLCSGTSDSDTLVETPSSGWREITLGAGYDLNADQKYAIVLRCPTSGKFSNTLIYRQDASSPTYAGGWFEYSNNAGVDWSTNDAVDGMFEEWGEEIVAAAGRSFGFIIG